MSFYDKLAYSSYIQSQNAESATLIFALTFTPDQSKIVTATTAGRLAFHSLPPAHPTTATVTLASKPSINALLTIDNTIYAATDAGLYRFEYDRPTEPLPVASGCVNALAQLDGSLLAATSDAIFHVQKDSINEIASLPPIAYPHCVTATSPTTFLAGCDDGTLRSYDVRRPEAIETPISNLTPRPYITSIGLNYDKNFALVADTSSTLTSIHLPTNSIAATNSTPFVPQALAFCDETFYCGGSESSVKALMRYDVRCLPQGSAPVSVDSVYAFAQSSSGALAAAGYCRNRKQLVDVYDEPPVRSYSLPV